MRLLILLACAVLSQAHYKSFGEHLCRDDACENCVVEFRELNKCVVHSGGLWLFAKTDDGVRVNVCYFSDHDCKEKVSERDEDGDCRKFDQGGSFKFECFDDDDKEHKKPKPDEDADHDQPKISRAECIERAQDWVDREIRACRCDGPEFCEGACPYCDSHRCDCAGAVSHWWNADHGYLVSSLRDIVHDISKDDLDEGDALLCHDESHVVLFESWFDEKKELYYGYHIPRFDYDGPRQACRSLIKYPFDVDGDKYKPVRYKCII